MQDWYLALRNHVWWCPKNSGRLAVSQWKISSSFLSCPGSQWSVSASTLTPLIICSMFRRNTTSPLCWNKCVLWPSRILQLFKFCNIGLRLVLFKYTLQSEPWQLVCHLKPFLVSSFNHEIRFLISSWEPWRNFVVESFKVTKDRFRPSTMLYAAGLLYCTLLHPALDTGTSSTCSIRLLASIWFLQLLQSIGIQLRLFSEVRHHYAPLAGRFNHHCWLMDLLCTHLLSDFHLLQLWHTEPFSPCHWMFSSCSADYSVL